MAGFSRRRVLRTGLTAGAIGIAGCRGNDGQSTTTTAPLDATVPSVPAGRWPMAGSDAVGSRSNPRAGPFETPPTITRRFDPDGVSLTRPTLYLSDGTLLVSTDDRLVTVDVERDRHQSSITDIDVHAVWGDRLYWSSDGLVAGSIQRDDRQWTQEGQFRTVRYAGGHLYALSPDGTLASFTADTGETEWQTTLDLSNTIHGPLVMSDTVTVGTQRELVTLARDSGTVEWRATPTAAKSNFSPPWFAGGMVMVAQQGVADGELLRQVQAFAAGTGTTQWTQSGKATYILPDAVVSGVGFDAGLGVDIATGERLFTVSDLGVVLNPDTTFLGTSERFLCLGGNGTITAFETDGTPAWTTAFETGFTGSIAVEDRLYLTTTDDKIYELS